ncbi:MAG: L,D-transpeptidase [Rhodospirillales bacterium]|nr:L,D-transpeptidase [Rhodospirillales bacterium]
MHDGAAKMRFVVGGTRLVLALIALAWPTLAAAGDASRVAAMLLDAGASPPDQKRTANFLGEAASDDVRRVADWAVASGDTSGMPFVLVDKLRAKVFVFAPDGRLRGASMALLGMARGDDSVAGIGSRKLSTIRPEERTTPAGRFVAMLGRDFVQDLLWVDYESSLSLHRVVTGAPGDHRSQRLATSSTSDKRISYGCINVPAKFYDDVVRPIFKGTRGIVYILPDTKPIEDVFAMSNDRATGNDVLRIR